MLLNEILQYRLTKCNPLELKDYSTFQLIKEEEFYFQTPVTPVLEEVNSKFFLFSAPGAVGKTAMAKYIAREYGAFYWNVGLHPVNGTTFAGELAHAVALDGERQNKFISDLRSGKGLVVLDGFDEASLISGREGVKAFLVEIGSVILSSAHIPTVILTARTEMAAFIRDVCREHGYGVNHYTVEYFEEEKAFLFIEKYLNFQGKKISLIQKKEIQRYLDEIKKRINTSKEVRAFMGYAQVLQILSRQIEKALDDDITNSLVLDSKKNNLIYDIIQELITREERKLDEFKNSIRSKYKDINKEFVVNNLYCKKEQLVRLQLFSLAGGVENIQVNDFCDCKELTPEDKTRYLQLLRDWLPQHVFLRDGKIMPIFSDYLFAESLFDEDLSIFAEEYQINGKAFRLPTRIFMDCYLSLNNFCVNSKDIFFLDAAYRSKNSVTNAIFCEIGPIDMENAGEVYLSYVDMNDPESFCDPIKIIREKDDPIVLNRVEHMDISVEGKIILRPGITKDVVIHQAVIECDELEFEGKEVRFETYADEENTVVAHKDARRCSDTRITITGNQKLQVDFPIGTSPQLRNIFYEFNRFFYSFDKVDKTIDIEQFVFGLKKALEQFRTDHYSGGPAKYKEKIDARCKSGIKKVVLDFLKDKEVLYVDNFKYMCSLERLSDLRINRESYLFFGHERYTQQLEYAYNEFLKWMDEQNINVSSN